MCAELLSNGQDSRLADAVVAYQMTLLQAVDGLNHRLEALDSGNAEPDPHSNGANTEPREVRTGNEVVDNLGRKLAQIEQADAKLQTSLDLLVKDFVNLASRWKLILVSRLVTAVHLARPKLMGQDGNKPNLVYVYNAIQDLKSWTSGAKTKETDKAKSGREHGHHGGENDEEEGGLLDLLSLLSVGGMLGFLAWTVQRRWRASRAAKGSKGF